MFKKICALFLALICVLGLFACAKKEDPKETTETKPDYTYDVNYPTEVPSLGEDSIQIHYHRADSSYSTWTLWLWDPEGNDDSVEDDFNYMDEFGVIASYPLSKFGELSGGKLGIIIKKKGVWTKDGTDSDRFIVFSNFKKDANGVYHVYFFGGDENIYSNPDKEIVDAIESASFASEKNICFSCTNAVERYVLKADGVEIASGSGAGKTVVNFAFPKDQTVSFSKVYTIAITFRGSGKTLETELGLSGLYSSNMFNDLYYYDGVLGATYSKEETVFTVWSPAATRIQLKIYENGTPTSVSKTLGSDACETYEMVLGDKAVYGYTLSGDQEGKYYTYVVYSPSYPNGKEIVDPYAKSAGVSGLRGMVVDFSKTNPEGWDSINVLPYDRKELTVWETHVADVTSSDTWGGTKENQRKYLGLIETGTTYTENGKTVSTGFDHIVDLGVNAVQLIPIFDQANDETKYTFNWGYNPLNYNVLEGMYSSNPYDGYARIKEFKEVVMAFNKAGINVIMDVVYNHVNGVTGSNFDVLMPGYYFRYKADGSLSNGSGCGNETASENAMMRKFIIDSVTFWASEYKLGGFRFDLMGLHDIETMNRVAEELKDINKHITVYGEPWTGGTSTLPEAQQAKQLNANKYVGYGQFNDQMRDALIKGGLNAATAKGWITNDTSVSAADVKAITNGINGITYNAAYTIADPNKTVNYVTCHDNYTLYDRIEAAGITDPDTMKKMATLADSVVFTSCGTTFMLAGDEMLRTKQGNSNSYNATDYINQLDYSLLIKNEDVNENFKKLIKFKKETAALHSDSKNINVESLDKGAILKYVMNDESGEYLVIHANGAANRTTIDTTGYSVYLDTLGKYTGNVNSVEIEKYQTLILVK